MKTIVTSLILLCCTILLFSFVGINANKYPTDFFSSPVRHSLLLTGTFGELRPNHFHAGIDIKSSRGVAGDPILAAGPGYVSRIMVEESGYGNSVFIVHPNGYTTVYGHLHEFSPAIAELVRRHQKETKSYEVDMLLQKDYFPVKTGQQIGTMGNSGASRGVHLHFEVRKSDTRMAINPLLFNLPVADNIPPKMHALRVYSLNESRENQSASNYPLLLAKDSYKVKGDTITVSTNMAGLGLKVYDHFDRVSNWNGVYRVSMYEDGLFTYSFEFEEFSFDETRYINAHCDYVERISKNSYFNRLYSLPGNLLSIYQRTQHDGVIHLGDRPKKISLVAADLAGNTSTLEFWIKQSGSSSASSKEKKFNYVLPYNEGNIIQTVNFEMNMPNGTLYETLYLNYYSVPENSANHYSNVHHLHNNRTPVHDYFSVSIKPEKSIPADKLSKAFIAFCEGKSVVNCGGTWKEGFLKTQVRNLGDYCIMLDETPPVIMPLNFKSDLKSTRQLSFRIYDNYQVAPNVKGLSYEAYVDGQWVLMEFDKKYARLTHVLNPNLSQGEHNFKLVVRDAVGNEAVYENKFLR